MASEHRVIVDDTDRGSPQYVAWLLLHAIARQEGKLTPGGSVKADKGWVLSTYAECLRATMDRL